MLTPKCEIFLSKLRWDYQNVVKHVKDQWHEIFHICFYNQSYLVRKDLLEEKQDVENLVTRTYTL